MAFDPFPFFPNFFLLYYCTMKMIGTRRRKGVLLGEQGYLPVCSGSLMTLLGSVMVENCRGILMKSNIQRLRLIMRT